MAKTNAGAKPPLASRRSLTILGPGQSKVMRTKLPPYVLWQGNVSALLNSLPETPIFDLVITSPPYNLGKEYESKKGLQAYLDWQREIIRGVASRLKPTGSLCWQVGNFVANGEILPLDILLHSTFAELDLKLRNRIIWRYGHGLHSKRRFSGRYEVVLWYSSSDNYVFNLDAVRVPPKYPGKRHYKGPRTGQFSSNPLGKNPEDVWDFPTDFWSIPNVKSNHVEKTRHPCQFPVGLAERLVLALSKSQQLVFDPFCGVGSAGVASALHGRYFLGAEITTDYCSIAADRINAALAGRAQYRPYDRPLYDHTKSSLSITPDLFSKHAR